ncbi:DNA-binding protein [Candidatus Sumerlaeota bacterium]|nr:DNA-binding protein [Candidatus Sumerlaeota bacterium]
MPATVNAAKCKSCGALSYPMHFLCPKCGAREFEPEPIEGEGELLTHTRAYALALDYEQRYLTLGIVQMDSGIRVTGQLAIDEPRMGMRVRATVGTVRVTGGSEISGLIFVPA